MSTSSNIDDNTRHPVFLATTACEEFWDTSMPIVFLGEQCCRYSKRETWEPLAAPTLEPLWRTPAEIREAIAYIDSLYERLLPLLSNALNRIHGTAHSDRYWRIMLGPWLLIYLPSLYDRHAAIRAALAAYPDMTTLLIDKSDWLTPSDTLSFVNFAKEDRYNLQLYSRILVGMGKMFPSRRFVVAPDGHAPVAGVGGQPFDIKSLLFKALIPVSRALARKRQVIFRASYFSWQQELALIARTRGRIWPILAPYEAPAPLAVDHALRSRLRVALPAQNDFERMLVSLILDDIPLCFVEGYSHLRATAARNYPPRARAILTANAWYYDETFKHWAGTAGEAGTVLLGVQHGGNYGSLLYHDSEKHEIDVVDRYYSWGWQTTATAGATSAKVTPMPASKLSGRPMLHASNARHGILFAASSKTRYLLQFPYLPWQFNDYLAWQQRFLHAIDKQISPLLRVRFHSAEEGWDIPSRWHDVAPETTPETWNVPFLDSLASCRLFICDHLSTTFVEALSADKPTILFWHPERNELRPEVVPFYDALRSASILHDTPESAAKTVSTAYADIEMWWNDPARQTARKQFCDRFARTDPAAIHVWANELKRVAFERGQETSGASQS